jgi:GT2 family glycosyltransferase
VSVVIATRDRPEQLAECLATVGRVLRDGDEMIVADFSADQDAVARIVAEHGGRLLRCTRSGTSYARNLGLAEARHEIVAFIDDDVRVSQDWLVALEDAMVSAPDVAFVTGRLDVPPDQLTYGRPVTVKRELEPSVLTPSTRGTLGHSANMAVRRSSFRQVRGFDERLGPGTPFRAAEDNDLFDRFFAAGYVGRYEPAANGWHEQWRSRSQLVKLEWSYGLGTGARLARLLRTNRGRARMVATEYLWRNGIRVIPRLVRDRYEYGVAFVLARVAGAAVGFLRGLLVGIDRRPVASPF